MAGRVLSIEIGYSLTRVCELDYKAKTPKVYKSFTVPTLEGVLNDGALQLDAHYLEGLRNSIREHEVKAKQVIFTITSGKIVNREFMVPAVKENRLGDVVRAKASESFPMDLSQYELAHSIMETVGEEKGKQQYKLMVLAVPSALLKGYYDLAASLRLEVVAIDYVGNSLYQIVKKECASGAHLIAKIDERSTLIMVVKDEKIAFTRNVAYGVEEALQVVIDSSAWGNVRHMRQAIQTVEKNQCIDLHAGEESDRPASSLSREETAQKNVTEALMPMINGIVRVIDYYASRNEAAIDGVHITGMGANFLGVDDLLQSVVSYPVGIIKKVEGLNLEKYFKEGFFGEYLSCIGAVMAPVNFKQNEDKGKAKGKGKGAEGAAANGTSKAGAVAAWLIFAIGLIATAGMAAYSILTYMEVERVNVELQHQVTDLMPVIDTYNQYVEMLTEYNQVTAMYEATESRNDELYEFLLELERKLPADVNVVSLTSEWDGVTISMNVSTKGEAAAAIAQLRSFESLLPESVAVASITEEEDDESGIVVNFTVAALYAPVASGDMEAAEE